MSEQSLKNKAVKGVAWNTINTITNLGVNFVVGIILARKLMPSDYGAVAMVGVFTSVLTLFTDGGGLTMALVRKENRTETDKATVFYYNFIACYFTYGVIFFVAPYIAGFYDIPILCSLARVSSLSLLITPLAGIQRMHLTSNMDFNKLAYVGVTGNVISAIISIWMACNGYGVWSLAVPGLFSAFVTTSMLIVIVRWYPRTGFSWISFKELFDFSSKLLGSQILNVVFLNITPLLVGKFFSSSSLGMYERAKGWPSMPSKTIAQVLQNVTFPVLSKMQDEKERLSNNYRRMLKMSAFIVFPMMILLAALARPLTIVIITAKWEDSIILMQLICLSMMWYPIHSINLNLLTVTGRSDYFFKLEVIKKILALVVLFCALPFGLVFFCAAEICSSILSLMINTYYSKRIINFGFIDQMKDLFPTILHSFIMGVLALGVQLPFENDIVKIAIGGLTGSFYYFFSAYLRKVDEWQELVLILKSRK